MGTKGVKENGGKGCGGERRKRVWRGMGAKDVEGDGGKDCGEG